MNKFYKDVYDLRGGRVLLYLNPKLKKPVWQMRIRVDGIKGYVVKSTKHQELSEAMRVAEDTYDDLKLRAKHGMSSKEISFKDFFHKNFLPYSESTASIHRQKVYKILGNKYLCGYFGDYKLEQINEALIDLYWDWRLTYWTKGPGKDEPKAYNRAEIPAAKSLKQDKSVLSQVMRLAKRRGFIMALPVMEVRKYNSNILGEGRETTFFSEEDYKKLFVFMPKFENEEGPRLHQLHKFQRAMVCNLVRFMVNSGLRPNEAWQLRWRDITEADEVEARNDTPEIDKNTKHINMYVRKTTKTGSRTLVPNPRAYRSLQNAKRLVEERLGVTRSGDDLVWVNESGEPMFNANKTVIKLFEEAGVLYNNEGVKRTLYSCRHTYASERLLNGVDVYDLATNMGTSVKYIQDTYDHNENKTKRTEIIKQTRSQHEERWAREHDIPETSYQTYDDPIAKEIAFKSD